MDVQYPLSVNLNIKPTEMLVCDEKNKNKSRFVMSL